MKKLTEMWIKNASVLYGSSRAMYEYRTSCPAVAEIIGHRFMRAVSVGTAPSVEIIESNEAISRDPRRWIFKPIHGKRLKTSSCEAVDKISRWVVLVEKIPRAVPLSFLRKTYGLDGGRIEVDLDDWFLSVYVPGILAEGKAELLNAAEFYSDFAPPDWSVIKREIAWDSEQMLRIHAARLFLGTSAAHASNILAGSDGRLYSVDHEFSSVVDGALDISVLFEDTQSGTRAFEALRGVAELSEEKLRALFEDLPVPDGARWFRWPLGSKEKTVDYYLERLRLWKLGFEKVNHEKH